MFRYNRFWHFWYHLSNRFYFRVFSITLLVIPAAVFFPPLWGLIALPVVTALVLTSLKMLSNFFYQQQNKRLMEIKLKTEDNSLKQEIDLYLNRRVVCPQELLDGQHINALSGSQIKSKNINAPLMLDNSKIIIGDQLNLRNGQFNRNVSYEAIGDGQRIFLKKLRIQDGLSEIAAREMAEILGFRDVIPSNAIINNHMQLGYLNNYMQLGYLNNYMQLGYLSRKNLIKLTEMPGVQNAMAKFIFNLKMAVYRTRAKNALFEILYIQKFMTNAFDGSKLFNNLLEDHHNSQISNIDIHSFQENFLLHLILGSQDANPGNTLFTKDEQGSLILHSIDHERIMPEDNYDVHKILPIQNGNKITEKEVKNIFPIRLWLAGLPQANIPFTKAFIEKQLVSLNSNRLLAYHQQKKLFSDAAVGAQMDRMFLIRKVFQEEIKKAKVSLPPKELFLKLINHHPTYMFLKKELTLHDSFTFLLMGQVPEGADMSLFRHPLQYFSKLKLFIELIGNVQKQQQLPHLQFNLFSKESFEHPYAHEVLFYLVALQQRALDKSKPEMIRYLDETTQNLKSR